MSYAQAKSLDQSLIPVVDIQPLRDGSDPKGVAKLLHAASQSLGLYILRGMGFQMRLLRMHALAHMNFLINQKILKIK